ncbi:hypothetical protein [Roseisolibacter sp. H3M3-2]|uniref:hypothetical protein n=1 Tax=Roseisolibacter sp. H3M3-2 TaxID=3031323 RepID=UPI0023D9A439|nr:hypothetical protein [Roseisolibacter sp. H3M3-2]MDF1503443.1 hypothetical protein [Roseisolibacter sp. H3M3-2]
MHEIDDAPTGAIPGGQGVWPTVKQRTAVQQAVTRLLDALAPERPPARGAEPAAPAVTRYRTPRGCILQGEARAVSVSWFPAATVTPDYGELQVISWEGVVSRPGATRVAGHAARTVSEELLHPVEGSDDAWVWKGGDGKVLPSAALVDRCMQLLEAPLPAPAAAVAVPAAIPVVADDAPAAKPAKGAKAAGTKAAAAKAPAKAKAARAAL